MKAIKLNMTQNFRQHGQLLLLTAFCLGMLLMRATLTKSIFYFFLVWNLFLAWTPYAITTILANRQQLKNKPFLFYPAFASWLLLLPNAPYLITDFVHLGTKASVPAWFDILLLISFAITGLLFGIASMRAMHRILTARFSEHMAAMVITATCFLSGFGVYLGRVLRYNSWDVLHSPFALTGDILYSLVAADTWRTAWGITLGFGTLLYLLYTLIARQKNL